jgi:hypothetical protein
VARLARTLARPSGVRRCQAWLVSDRDAARRIGIGHVKPRQNIDLQPLHRLRIAVGFVIEAEKVEITMDGQMREVMRGRWSSKR